MRRKVCYLAALLTLLSASTFLLLSGCGISALL
ncbi:hypothetical protein MOMUL_12080 [Moorella mulderi DSM 14980]|uniref:Lipoprotein n=1 Tax=Moorella mulderi DSM 14980 TaxID=1122241 RepID=A0A151AY93_9FIRM|nr:hypothetical protein MOMUL_12080 [Moorella mulderi DSM 14980]